MFPARHDIHLWISTEPVNTRYFIRAVMAPYLQQAPRRVRLTTSAAGKPQLWDRRHGDLQFNVSHSHGLSVCVVARGLHLGVDVEYLPRHNRIDDIAARYFHPEEQRQLQAIADEAGRRRLFFEFWTRKEAWIKAMGKTIGTAINQVHFHTVDGHVQVAFPLPIQERWEFHTIPLGGDYLVATARARRPWQAGDTTISLFHFGQN